MWRVIASGAAVLLILFAGAAWAASRPIDSSVTLPAGKTRLFAIESIDTMKESRDNAQIALENLPAYLPAIDAQMQLIEDAGANYVAIDTPYDPEFLPVLRAWVASARAHHLSVFFRGNFSGWEGWFDFPKITRTQHLSMLTQFITQNPDLFQNGDIFTPCPECENGGPGDPRQTGDAQGYDQFLADEYTASSKAFAAEGKKVAVLTSMNADIARQVLTPQTIEALGGTILIDHYVSTPAFFERDISTIPGQIGATVGIGEFGAPIPDLQGDQTPDEQAQFVNQLLAALYRNNSHIPLVNYWTLSGGSTALVDDSGAPWPVYTVLKDYYIAPKYVGVVYNTLGEPLDATVTLPALHYSEEAHGAFSIFVPQNASSFVEISAPGYESTTTTLTSTSTTLDIYLSPTNPSPWYRFRQYFHAQG